MPPAWQWVVLLKQTEKLRALPFFSMDVSNVVDVFSKEMPIDLVRQLKDCIYAKAVEFIGAKPEHKPTTA